MASEETPVKQENLDEKLGDLKLEEPEKKEAVLEELSESPPKLHHVGTPEPAAEPTEDGGVVKAEVPEAFQDELKSDHDIVPPAEEKSDHDIAPPAEEKSTSTVDSVATQTGPAGGQTETPVEVTHENVDTKPPAKHSSFGEKISATLHKIVGKD